MLSFQERFQSLQKKILPIEEDYKQLIQQKKISQTQQEKLKREIEESKSALEFQTECVEWTKQILEMRGKEHLEKITQLLSLALQTIFFDRNYEFVLQVEEKRGSNTAQFVLWEMLTTGEVVEIPLSEVGGSIRTVVGLVLQTYFLNFYNLYPVLFIDEALGSLSEAYIPSLMGFLKELSKQNGIIFVMISHDERVFDFADKTYEIKNHTSKLKK